MGWILTGEALHDGTGKLAPYVPDLRRNRFYLWLSKYHWITQVVVGVAVLAAFGWKVMLWAVFLRTVVGLHGTWLVNSATHLWGSQRWATGDDSTNNFWIALRHLGRGLAQQSPRPPQLGAPRTALVGGGHQLVRHPGPALHRDW